MRQAPFLDFPLPEYERRLTMVRQDMAAEGIDLLVLTLRDSVEYLCGFTTVSWRLTDKAFWLLVPLEQPIVLLCDPIHTGNVENTCCANDVRYWGPDGSTPVDLLKDFVGQSGGEGSVGLEIGLRVRINMSVPDYHAVRELIGARPVVDAAAIIGRARLRKCAMEIKRVREACRITEQVIGDLFPELEPGISERDIVRDLAVGFLELGADTPLNATNGGYLGVNGGRLTQTNPVAVDRHIEHGDLLRLDGGCVYRGYGADISRNTVVGAVCPEPIRRAAKACDQVMDTTLAAIRPGIRSAEIYRIAHDAIDRVGYNHKRRFTMDRISASAGSMIGHSTGFCMHEDPFITPSDQTVWEAGMTGSVEFGLGEPQYGYADFEDNFVIHENGCENLSPGPRFIESVKVR